MIDIVSIYCNMVINPIEDNVKELRAKVYSKNFFDWLNRRLYKEYLEKTEKMLFDRYKRLEVIIQEEIDFNNELKEKFKNID
jgi:hypothetical protein